MGFCLYCGFVRLDLPADADWSIGCLCGGVYKPLLGFWEIG